MVHPGASLASGNLFARAEASGTSQGTTGVPGTDGVLSTVKWNALALTYAFPTSSSWYPASYSPDDEPLNGFEATTASMQAATRWTFDHVASFTNLTFTELNPATSTAAQVDIALARSSIPNTAWAYYPGGGAISGDVWFGTSFDSDPINGGSNYTNPIRGGYAWITLMHELGHSLGLKHGHESDPGFNSAVLPTDRDSMEFSIMTYRSHVGASVENGYLNEDFGYAQTFMMDDIAALQAMYGADYTTNSGNTTYSFSATTGEMSINGVGQGAPGANRVFRTVWDGGGNDTYDFSNYTTHQTINLNPGEWSTLSAVQLANLGDDNMARGNLANALLHANDLRSLIENAFGGVGNDTITGNVAANDLRGNGGADSLSGGIGNDTLDGGTGSDTLAGGEGDDTIIHDAADTTANVTGGGGTDTLLVRGGNAPTGFNLAAQGFEAARHEMTDTTGQSWSTITDHYNASWQRSLSNIAFDNGTRQDRVFDWQANQVYSEYVNDYGDIAFASSVTRQIIIADAGTREERFFDYRSNQAYSEYINSYLDIAFASSVTRQVILADSGTKQERFFDYRSNQSYVEYVNDYADAGLPGAVTRQVTFFDDGTRQERFFDYNNSQAAYSEYINFYNAAGQLNRQVGFNNAGAQAWEYFY